MTVTLRTLEGLFASQVAGAVWPFFRVAGMVMVAPVFGSRLVPMRLRAALSVAITFAIAPALAAPAFNPSGADVLVIAQEILLGVVIGFSVQMVFDAMVIAGQTVAMSMGLGFAMMVDPQRGVSVPVLSQFFLILGTLTFLSLGGHLALIRMLGDSFQWLPIGESVTRAGIWSLLLWGGEMFAGAIRIALPAVAALLVVNLAFGVMSRAAPALNLFAIGFPAALMIGFVILLLDVGSLPSVIGELLQSAFGNVAASLRP